MPRALLIGGAGFIGAHVAHRLTREGATTYVFDHASAASTHPEISYRYDRLLGGARLIHGDASNPDQLAEALRQSAPDVVIHLAAESRTDVALQDPVLAFERTARPTAVALAAMRTLRTRPRFVYVSSSMVYGDFDRSPLDEAAEKRPREPYGGHKYVGEVLVGAYSNAYSFPHVIVRPTAVYGPAEVHPRLIRNLLIAGLTGEPAAVRNPDTTRLDFTYVDDLADGIVRAALVPGVEGEVFNLSRGESRTVAEAVTIVRSYFPDVNVRESFDPDFRPQRGALSIEKAGKLLGFTPRCSLESGIEQYVAHLRAILPLRSTFAPAP